MAHAAHAAARPPALAAHFPPSTARPSNIFKLVGTTPQSTATVRRLITENDRAYDMYYADPSRYAHNHMSHSLFARYALGATSARLEADWEAHRDSLAVLDPVEGKRFDEIRGIPDTPITTKNWTDPSSFLKKGAYSHYLAFFHKEIERLGPLETARHYLFSAEANAPAVCMTTGLVCGVVHPFIHIGYGLEFGDNVVLAEGLAQNCISPRTTVAPMFPSGWPYEPLGPASGPSLPLLGLLAEFYTDPSLHPGPYKDTSINDRLTTAASPERVRKIHDLVARWNLDDMSDQGVHERMSELAWLVTLIMGATSRPGYPVRMDFFLMHTVTASLFIPAYCAVANAIQRRAVFQTFLITVFQMLLARGRPQIFAQYAMEFPMNEDENPWFDVITGALQAEEAHVPKAIRSLVYFSQQLGHVAASTVPGAISDNGGEALPGLADVDGTLFLRVATKLIEVTEQSGWSYAPPGWDETWKAKM